MDSLYDDVCNFGYLNYADNCTSFALNGSTVSARLASSLIRTDLRLVESGATYQERLFTLSDLTSPYLEGFPISRIGQHTYECSDAGFMQDVLSIVAPNLNNRGGFVIPERVLIELGQPGDGYAFRFRLYISHLNYGALIDEHRVDEYPSWKYLFAEATISNVGTTTFSPANGLLNLG